MAAKNQDKETRVETQCYHNTNSTSGDLFHIWNLLPGAVKSEWSGWSFRCVEGQELNLNAHQSPSVACKETPLLFPRASASAAPDKGPGAQSVLTLPVVEKPWNPTAAGTFSILPPRFHLFLWIPTPDCWLISEADQHWASLTTPSLSWSPGYPSPFFLF